MLKFGLLDQRAVDQKKLSFRDKGGNISDKMSHYGSVVNKIFPLLDPDIYDDSNRMEKHQVWWLSSKATSFFLTEQVDN